MEVRVGTVTHYWDRIQVAGVDLTAPLHVGDIIHIKGHKTDLEQPVQSIEIEHHHVDEANAGDSVGIKVLDKVREHDTVFLVSKEQD